MIKKIRTLVLLILFLLLGRHIASGQTSGKTITLKPYSTEKNVCILFQNDSFLIITSTKFLTDFYNQSSDTTKGFIKEREMFNEIKNDNLDTINFYLYASQKYLNNVMIDRAEGLLLKGKCVIVNRKANQPVFKVKAKSYNDFDRGGIAYYVGNKLLLKTIEWIY